MSTHLDKTIIPITADAPRAVAVIDVGTASIRMAIGEIAGDEPIRTLETLSRPVAIGKDTFTRGAIDRSTIEDCVRVLISYREVLDSYGIREREQLRCVATSAVREASNRLAFVDRIYIATGIQVEILDEAEISRVTFLGIQPTLKNEDLAANRSVVVEVGGGSTELLVVHKSQVEFSHTYSLGSLRLRETLGTLRMPVRKQRQVMENQIDRFVNQAMQQIPDDDISTELIALGGDFRFAAGQLVSDQVEGSLATIPIQRLESFVDVTFRLPIDEIVHDFRLTYPDAETLAPALLTVLAFARRLGSRQVRVSNVNLRDGLLQEIANQGVWSEDFIEQVMNSALEMGRHYQVDEAHARHVAHLSQLLFRSLRSQHRLEDQYEVMLQLAALLHEIGLFVGIASYHKHTMYLIQNSELFGLSERDLRVVAQVARYHRRASPKPSHSGYAVLNREDRVVVTKLASILRVAVGLDRSNRQRIRELDCSVNRDRLIISVPGVDDLSLEQIAIKQSGGLFEETYGLSIMLRQAQL